MFNKKILISSLIVVAIFAFGATALSAWETPIAVSAKTGYKYYKPEIGVAPSGGVYITYREKEPGAGNSDIMMCYYDGKTMTYHNVSEGASSYARYKAYESDNEVTADGIVHVAWMSHNRDHPDVHYIKYRYLDGNTWSDIVTLAQMGMHDGEVAFDLRLGVDNNGNVHVVTYKEHATTVWYAAKYGDTILPLENIGNPGSRLKHPDIAVDDNYVHMTWMRKIGFPYVIVYQKRENRIGGTKSTIKQITFPTGTYASQKSRIDLDTQGFLHHAEYHKTGIIKKLKYYKELPDGSFTSYVNLSHPTKLQLYHWAGLEVRDNSIIATMQLGSTSGGNGIFFNWKRNSVWGGYSAIPGTGGAVHQSVDLTADGELAVVAYGMKDTAVMLVASGEISATGSLETEFSHPDMVFWDSEVSFDASQSTDLNPDYNIVNYEWDFGDGTTETTTGPTVSHSYNAYGIDVTITLTINAETGETGTITKDIRIHALFNAIISAVNARRLKTLFYDRAANELHWNANPLNVNAGYPAITKYEIWRAPLGSSLTGDAFVKLGEVDAGTAMFLDYQDVIEGAHYVYSIRSVDGEGHISPFDHYSNDDSQKIKAEIIKRRLSL